MYYEGFGFGAGWIRDVANGYANGRQWLWQNKAIIRIETTPQSELPLHCTFADYHNAICLIGDMELPLKYLGQAFWNIERKSCTTRG